jgi:hypothetical protein
MFDLNFIAMVLYHIRCISTPLKVKCVSRYDNKAWRNQPFEIEGIARDLVLQYNASMGSYEEVEDSLTDDDSAFPLYLTEYIYYFDIKVYVSQKVKSHNHMHGGNFM